MKHLLTKKISNYNEDVKGFMGGSNKNNDGGSIPCGGGPVCADCSAVASPQGWRY